MEDDLKNFKMEDDLKNFKMEDDLKNFKIEDDLKNFKMEDDGDSWSDNVIGLAPTYLYKRSLARPNGVRKK